MKLLAISLATAVAMIVAAPSANAGHLGRTDLLHVSQTFNDPDQPAGVDAGAFIFQSDSQFTGSVFVTAANVDSSAGYSVAAQAIDSAKVSSKATKTTNKKFSWASAFTNVFGVGSESTGDVQMEDCSLALATKGTAPSTVDSAKWKGGCKSKTALADVGLGTDAQTRLLTLFDSLGVERVKPDRLDYKGQVK